MGNIIENQTYYFSDDIINITNFHPNLLKIGKKLYKMIDIYHIRYVTIKDSEYVKINTFSLTIGAVDRYIQKKKKKKKKMEINI